MTQHWDTEGCGWLTGHDQYTDVEFRHVYREQTSTRPPRWRGVQGLARKLPFSTQEYEQEAREEKVKVKNVYNLKVSLRIKIRPISNSIFL